MAPRAAGARLPQVPEPDDAFGVDGLDDYQPPDFAADTIARPRFRVSQDTPIGEKPRPKAPKPQTNCYLADCDEVVAPKRNICADHLREHRQGLRGNS